MNRGYFKVTKELLESEQWPSIESEIKKDFREVHQKEIENGIVEIHGYSPRFTIQPIEGASQQYDLYFAGERLTDIKPVM